MAHEQSQALVVVGQLGLEQAEAVDGGAVDAGEVVIVGLVARVGGLAKMFAGEGVHQPRLPAAAPHRALHRPMVLAGALDGGDQIADVMGGGGLPDLVHGRL